VVRDSPDVLALEKFRSHPWKYHILQGFLSPLSGIGPQQIKVQSLFERIHRDNVQEVILAFDATVEGDATALFIREHLRARESSIQLTRMAMGLPAGASVEYLDASTLENALIHRTNLE
jgi:recombination protein RecR